MLYLIYIQYLYRATLNCTQAEYVRALTGMYNTEPHSVFTKMPCSE